MAISSALRRAPWAAAARGLLAARSGWRVHPRQPHPHRAECSALLSSLSAPQLSAVADAQLLRVINYEISCAQQDCRKRDWAKEFGEEFPFEIQDKEGTNRITLTRRDQKERIEVEVFLPSPADSVEQNGEQEDQVEDANRQGHASNAAANQYYIPLVVKIHKGAAWLEISCRSYPDELAIDSLAFGPRDESVDSSDVEAKISNLPEEFQQALYSYLKSRAISSDVTNFLHAYMINKECHEYLAWLRKLKGLMKR
ncbi:hypothetical protein SETIT_3G220000v2 [Setaria italica]|uniref:Uncharacterized protein n=1 Tax=Setaria italica TaxID=4555 RepID=K3Z906_SETIT|nr:uncharacterized protein At2g39795, mitochondrial [Setaria italica]RCV17443.1 hypothetical protein SETIT_3G220000v2 [Setaria italica]